MRVLLVYCPVRRSSGAAKVPKLGLGYLASVLRLRGHYVRILDPDVRGMRFSDVCDVLAQSWDMIGFQVFAASVESLRFYLDAVRTKRTVCVAGGPLTAGLGTWLLRNFARLDFAIAGEAEESLPALCEALSSGQDPTNIAGLIYRRNGQVLETARPIQPDVMKIPWPAWDLMPLRAYPRAPLGAFARAFPVAPLLTARGCHFHCSYCAVRAMFGRGVRVRQPDDVLAEMEELVKRWGANEIQIVDDCFGYDRKVAEEILVRLSKAPWRVPVSMPNGIHLELVDRDFAKLLREAGVYAVTVGIDFGTERMFRFTGRKLSREKILRGLRILRDLTDIRVTGNFILGHFHDDLEGMKETISFAKSLPLDRAHFSAYVPIPGTRDWRTLGGEKVLDHADLSSFDFYSFTLPHPTVSRRSLMWLKRRAYLEFYLSPGRLGRLVLDLRHPGVWSHIGHKIISHFFSV